MDAARCGRLRDYAATHFRWQADADGKVATITLDRPETQESADVRLLRRAARPVPRPRLRERREVPSSSTGAGGNFCSGGDVHEIIGPLTKMAMPELLAFTRMTGDLVQGDARLPAADRRRGRRHVRRRRRDGRAGLRHPLRHAGGEDRVPVHARRARRLRHGRLHAAAADDRPGPRGRAALHRPRDDRRRGRGVGLLQPARRAGRARWPRRRRLRARSPTARRSRTR